MVAESMPTGEPKQNSEAEGAGVDLEELARKVTQLLLFEMQLENERLGRE